MDNERRSDAHMASTPDLTFEVALEVPLTSVAVPVLTEEQEVAPCAGCGHARIDHWQFHHTCQECQDAGDRCTAFTEVPVEKDLSHEWVVAAAVKVTAKVAKRADLRGSFRAEADQRIDALEVYCGGCRRPYDEVADQACEAKIDNTHLIGGDPGVRKKRKIADNTGVGELIRGPQIVRQGAAALVAGGSL